MASHGTAEANVKVMLQVVIAGAAVCLGNRTFYLHPPISHFFESLLFLYSLWAVGWQFMPPSFLMCCSRLKIHFSYDTPIPFSVAQPFPLLFVGFPLVHCCGVAEEL